MEKLIFPSNIDFPGLKAFFTTRLFAGKEIAISESLSAEFNIQKDNIYLPIQKHTGNVYQLESDFTPVVADAVITSQKNILIGVLVADCVPILLFDRKRQVTGAVHAGWRGTAQQILVNTINIMEKAYSSSAKDIFLAIGPCIRQCSYEVDEKVKNEVYTATGAGNYYMKEGDKYFLDLSIANKVQALNTGIAEENIWQSEECTFCKPETFYSYRYSKGVKGRQGGFIGMW